MDVDGVRSRSGLDRWLRNVPRKGGSWHRPDPDLSGCWASAQDVPEICREDEALDPCKERVGQYGCLEQDRHTTKRDEATIEKLFNRLYVSI